MIGQFNPRAHHIKHSNNVHCLLTDLWREERSGVTVSIFCDLPPLSSQHRTNIPLLQSPLHTFPPLSATSSPVSVLSFLPLPHTESIYQLKSVSVAEELRYKIVRQPAANKPPPYVPCTPHTDDQSCYQTIHRVGEALITWDA